MVTVVEKLMEWGGDSVAFCGDLHNYWASVVLSAFTGGGDRSADSASNHSCGDRSPDTMLRRGWGNSANITY